MDLRWKMAKNARRVTASASMGKSVMMRPMELNEYNFGARIYDPRLGRWLSVDPLVHGTPQWSPHVLFNNCLPFLLIQQYGFTLQVKIVFALLRGYRLADAGKDCIRNTKVVFF